MIRDRLYEFIYRILALSYRERWKRTLRRARRKKDELADYLVETAGDCLIFGFKEDILGAERDRLYSRARRFLRLSRKYEGRLENIKWEEFIRGGVGR